MRTSIPKRRGGPQGPVETGGPGGAWCGRRGDERLRGGGRTAEPRLWARSAHDRAAHGDRPRGLCRHRRAGVGPREESAADQGRATEGRMRHPPRARQVGPAGGRQGRAAQADRILQGRPGLRPHVRDRGPRPGLHRHAMALARAGLRGGHEKRQARRDGGRPAPPASTSAGSSSRTPRSTAGIA